MDWKKFDVEDKSTHPKKGDYFIWMDGANVPMAATFHNVEKYGSHWWEYPDVDDLEDNYVTYYAEIIKPF